MTAEPIRVAVVGLGKIARDQHLPALRSNPAFALAATVCPFGERAEGVPGFATLAEFTLGSGRRVDVMALSPSGQLWIVEIKSSLEDFRAECKEQSVAFTIALATA